MYIYICIYNYNRCPCFIFPNINTFNNISNPKTTAFTLYIKDTTIVLMTHSIKRFMIMNRN